MTEPATEPVPEGSSQAEDALVSYSGLEEYLPICEQAGKWGSARVSPGEWESFATFQVEFQTRQVDDRIEQRLLVHNLNTGTIETWSSLNTDSLQQWITDQTGKTLMPAKLEISQVQIFQCPQAGTLTVIGDRSLQTIRANQPFLLKILVRCLGGQKAGQELPIGCQIRCQVRNLSTGTATLLYDATADCGSAEDLVAEDLVAESLATESLATENPVAESRLYQCQLSGLILPEPGIYRPALQLILPEPLNLSTCCKMPILQAV